MAENWAWIQESLLHFSSTRLSLWHALVSHIRTAQAWECISDHQDVPHVTRVYLLNLWSPHGPSIYDYSLQLHAQLHLKWCHTIVPPVLVLTQGLSLWKDVNGAQPTERWTYCLLVANFQSKQYLSTTLSLRFEGREKLTDYLVIILVLWQPQLTWRCKMRRKGTSWWVTTVI